VVFSGISRFTVADFRHVPTHCKFVALMPQWDFLDFLSAKARKFFGILICVCSTRQSAWCGMAAASWEWKFKRRTDLPKFALTS